MSEKTMRELPAGLRLSAGNHEPGKEMCVEEAAAWRAGEPWSDAPECVCPVIAAFLRVLNDRMPDDQRQRLLPYVDRQLGTRSTPEVELRRAYVAADWAVRRMAPLALEARGLTAEAKALRDLPQIVDRATARSAAQAARWAARTPWAAAEAEATQAARWAARSAEAAAAMAAAASERAAEAAWDVALGCLDAMLEVTA